MCVGDGWEIVEEVFSAVVGAKKTQNEKNLWKNEKSTFVNPFNEGDTVRIELNGFHKN